LPPAHQLARPIPSIDQAGILNARSFFNSLLGEPLRCGAGLRLLRLLAARCCLLREALPFASEL
jgi:hypothetical protein